MPDDAFLKLRNEWYKKLADEGFEDIEHFHADKLDPDHRLRGDIHGEGHLEERLTRPLIYETTTDYYRVADAFYWGNDWSGRKDDKRVWGLHKDGASIREIERAMGWHSRKKTYSTIKRLQAEMKRYTDDKEEA